MHRKRLVATVAAAPLLFFASAAMATDIDTAVTTPVRTSDTNQDVKVTKDGSIKPTVTGPALLMDSNHDITNEGTISTTDVDGSVGMQSSGGRTGDITNKGIVSIVEDYTPTDTDPDGEDGPLTGDGDLDGPFAEGAGRYGILVTPGAGALTGNVINERGGSITVEGNGSAGISLESDLTGDLINRGTISVTGGNTTDGRSYGVRATGDVSGDVFLGGSVSAVGEGASAASIEGDVGDSVVIQGAYSARGYRYSTRPADEATRDILDADDLLIGGPAVQVSGNVANGILLDIRPTDEDEEEDDEDNDGIPDAEEGNASITSFGTAPALLVGSSTQSITVGAVGTGDNAFGLINRGTMSADGVYDEQAATALQIGGSGGTTTIEGGVRNDGSITARAFEADSTAVRLTNGATLDGVFLNKGTITSQVIGGSGPLNLPSPLPGAEGEYTATGVLFQAGSNAPTVNNAGVIAAAAFGEKSDAVAIRDLSDTVRTIQNTGRIQAVITPTDDAKDIDDPDLDPSNEVIEGEAIAIDVSASTLGVTITQSGIDDGDDGDDGIDDPDADGDGVDDADEPLIFGKVLLGSGADTLNIANGVLDGDIAFGAGADALNITGGAFVRGKLTDTDGLLDINIADGLLIAEGTDTLEATSLNIGGDGTLLVSIDAENEVSTRFNVDTANLADGAQLGVQIDGLLEFENLGDTKDFLVIDAGSLTVGDINQDLLGATPYLYNIGVVADTTANEVRMSVRRRTAAEAGLNASQTAAYDAFYLALGEDDGIRDAVLGEMTREGFLESYNQMLPDQGEGLFTALDYVSSSIGRAVGMRPDPKARYGPDSFWLQELNVQVKRDAGDTLGSDTKGFGFVGGYEAMDSKGGALGVTLAYVTAEEEDEAAKVGEQTSASLVELGAYWRKAAGSWLFSVRGGGGYAFFDGTRRFISVPQNDFFSPSLVRTAESEWNGLTASANATVAYEARFGGRYYMRPALGLDYFYLREDGREESGGGQGFDLTIEERTSDRLSGSAELALGAEFGRDVWWRPEVKVGYRHAFSGKVGDTVAAFAGGQAFTLVAADPGEGAAVLGFALRAGTPMSYLALEAEMERMKNEQRYKAQLSGRVMF